MQGSEKEGSPEGGFDEAPNLSSAEVERLALLAEELGEAIQAIGKILRHGYRSRHPKNNVIGPDNRSDLEKELGDVQAAIGMMTNARDVDWLQIDNHAELKRAKVIQYLHHQDR